MRNALIEAIRAAPDDDLARLAYADQLEEQGRSEQARFVRVQLEEERLPEHDLRRNVWTAEAELMQIAHEREWLGDWADLLVRWTFKKGLLHSVVLQPEVFEAHGERLFLEHPVHEVRFVRADGEPAGPEAAALPAHPAFAWVRALDASGAESMTGPAWVQALARSPHVEQIEELNFDADWRSNAGLTDAEALRELCRADRLRRLKKLTLARYIHENEGPADDLVEWLAEAPFAPGLTKLNLGKLPLTDAGLRTLLASRLVQRLESLDLSYCEQLGANGLTHLLRSRRLKRLTSLSLGGAVPIDELARSRLLPRLTDLGVTTFGQQSGLEVPTAHWAMLGSSPDLGRLRSLELYIDRIGLAGHRALLHAPGTLRPGSFLVMGPAVGGDAAAEVLATAPALAELTKLEAAYCGLTSAGVARLLEAPFIPRLRLFCVAGNTIQLRGLRHALRSPLSQGRLAVLHLHSTRLPPSALRALFAWPPLAGITHLELDPERLDARTMTALCESPHLQQLSRLLLAGGAAPDEGLQVLARARGLPRLRHLSIHGPLHGETEAALRRRFGARLNRRG